MNTLVSAKAIDLFARGLKVTKTMDQFFQEGRAVEEGLTAEAADPDELRIGEKVELEHTSDMEVARKIALDHLAEFPNYYSGLKKMEELLAAGIPPDSWGQ